MRLLTLVAALAIAASDAPIEQAQARLARGDAEGAARALEGVACPPPTSGASRANWLDASARIAWQRGRADEAFALSVQAIACAERAGVKLASFLPAFVKDGDWIDEGCGLACRALPAGEPGASRELAAALASSVEAEGEDGAWVRVAARVLDPSRPAESNQVSDGPSKAARRRMAFLQAASAARSGEAEAGTLELRRLAREAPALQPMAHWFEAEAWLRRATPDPRAASLRFVQCAAALEDAGWIRAAALRRAAGALDTIDPAEASRLRAAADEETP